MNLFYIQFFICVSIQSHYRNKCSFMTDHAICCEALSENASRAMLVVCFCFFKSCKVVLQYSYLFNPLIPRMSYLIVFLSFLLNKLLNTFLNNKLQQMTDVRDIKQMKIHICIFFLMFWFSNCPLLKKFEFPRGYFMVQDLNHEINSCYLCFYTEGTLSFGLINGSAQPR